MEGVIQEIRALLVSTKGKVSLGELDRDFKSMVGTRIPYSTYGYGSLEAFLKSQPCFTVTNVQGQVLVDAIISGKSAHISQMVGRQKTSKKRVPSKRFPRFDNQRYQPRKYAPPPPSSYRSNNSVYTRNTPSYHVRSERPPQNHFHTKKADITSRLQIHSPKENTSNHVSESPVISRERIRVVDRPVNTDVSNKDKSTNSTTSSVRRRNIDTKSTPKPTEMNGGTKFTTNPTEMVNSNKSSCSSLVSTKQRLSARMKSLQLSSAKENRIEQSGYPGSWNSPAYSPTMPTSPLLDFVNLPQAPESTKTVPHPATRLLLASGKNEAFSNKTVHQRSRQVQEPKKTEVISNKTVSQPVRLLPEHEKSEVEFCSSGNPVEDLIKYVEFQRLGDVKISPFYITSRRSYSCKVTAGREEFLTFPTTYKTEEQAKNACCEQALECLMAKYNKNRALLVAEPQDVLDRVPKMLKEYGKALWEWQVEDNYIDTFNERLPEDWLKIINVSPVVQIDKVPKGCILSFCTPESWFQKAQPLSPQGQYICVPPNVLELDNDRMLSAIVTCIVKADEIWCRQDDTDCCADFEKMSTKMNDFYESNSDKFLTFSITKDSYYVMKYKDNWCRMRVVTENSLDVKCFLIDYGDIVIMPKNKIYQLVAEFMTIMAQAFVCRLQGLEHLYTISEHSKSLDILENQHVIIELIGDGEENDPCWPVVMYSSNLEFSYNEVVETKLLIESAAPELEKGQIVQVSISNIAKNGDVYVQLETEGFYSLLKLLHEVEEQVEKEPPTHLIKPVTRQNSEGKLYFQKFKSDGHWYRVSIIDWAPNRNLAQIYYVDYGHTDVIDLDEELLYLLEDLDQTLALYPYQAVRVFMMMDSVPEDFKELASKYMNTESHDDNTLLKIVDYNEDNLPLGEFFKRHADGSLFCINKSIVLENELKKDSANNNFHSLKRNWINKSKIVPSGGVLPCPDLPENRATFEVYVPFAVSPYNFFVQPLHSRKELNEMMKSLLEHYENIQPSPLPLESIEPGLIYASKHEGDPCWYRTTVLKVINETSISVFYCDYGYYTNLSVYNLVPLDHKFMKLPFQALKAKMPDIKPVQSKWTMDDCEEFKKMVEKKPFFCILMDREKDELYPEDIVLNLVMIDTSSNNDVYISKELIRQGRAIDALNS